MRNKIYSAIIILAIAFLLVEIFFVTLDPDRKNVSENKTGIIFKTDEKTSSQFFELDIPFTSQAPLGDWNPPFDHACEEASVLMAHYYFEGITPTPQLVANDIDKMVAFEKEKYGVYKDTSASETAGLIRDYYGYNAKVIFDTSASDIKNEILKGNVVIAPTKGRALKNPYFTPPGPVYHMLVVKGYDSSGFITNDPGTRRGKDYKYSFDILMNAISDWDNGALNGRSAIISVSRQGY